MADVKATVALKKALNSAVTASRTEEVKKILQQLKAEVVATEELVRETKIGVAVNKLRSHADGAVASLAKEIVRKWKADVGTSSTAKSTTASAAQSPTGSGSNIDSPAPGGSPPVIAQAPPVPVKTVKVPVAPTATSTTSNSASSSLASTSVLPPKLKSTPSKPSPSSPAPVAPTPKRRESLGGAPRTHKTDGLDFGSGERATEDKTRDKCAEMVYDALASDSDAPTDLIEKRARDLENHVFAQHPPPSGTNAYRQKMRSLFLNLKAANNPSLRGDVVSGEISVQRLYAMRPEEMASEEQQAQNRKLAEKNLFDAQAAAPQQAETDAFQCGKCKQRRCMYYQMQTRSADEPMTTFVTCLSCNNRWKFS